MRRAVEERLLLSARLDFLTSVRVLRRDAPRFRLELELDDEFEVDVKVDAGEGVDDGDAKFLVLVLSLSQAIASQFFVIASL